ncbi:DNA repair protein RecN [Micropruina sp.]|uniref:DNA repair protein RecN n=1 Tax=Micropruina sp. TaxID=2737536 RepID=UPI002605048F|nr:DNA repair protein RecN [Micropruina sp.]
MLTELRIADLGVIAEAVLEPGPGFTAVTGETGAGKTMVVTGLSLLLGGRADSGLVRHGAARCVVEGVWTIDGATADELSELGAEVEDGELLVARQVGRTRSRALLGGVAVPLGTAADIVTRWATIHGQSEQIRLGTADRQREVLDRFAGAEHAVLLERHAAAYAERRAAASEVEELTGAARERARELDLLTFGLNEIEQVDPQPDEDVALAAEAQRLQAVDELRLAAHGAGLALSGDPEAWDDAPTVLGLLAAARKSLEGAVADDPELVPLAGRLAEASVLAADVASELASYADRLEAEPARLEWIAERRAALQQLTRKYGASVAEVLQWAADAAERARNLEAGDDRIAELQQRIAVLDEELAQTSAAITAARAEAAAVLAERVKGELTALAMPHARIEFELTPAAVGPHGADQVTLMFTANPGSSPAPLAKAASGGELSRVRLALEVVLAGGATGQTFVFDEVDAGVGGAVALEIGRRLARLAEHAQVIVVTHLAQVAAFADDHFVVAKASDGQVTTSGINRVDGAARLDELARMMAGLEGSANAHAHAAELLAAAGH